MIIWYCYGCQKSPVDNKTGRCAVCNQQLHNIGNIEGSSETHVEEALGHLEQALERAIQAEKA